MSCRVHNLLKSTSKWGLGKSGKGTVFLIPSYFATTFSDFENL